jgi:hypothetical protein
VAVLDAGDAPVWNLTVADRHEYVANGLFVYNSIRNAAMRFGVALDLWRKHASEEQPAPLVVASGPPCPHCGTPVGFNEEATRGKRPVWFCPNRGCGGGSPRDKTDPMKGNWPWGSYDPNYFQHDPEPDLEVTQPARSAPAVPADAFDSIPPPTLASIGVTDLEARAELETYRDSSLFAAGSNGDMRKRVNRAVLLLVATGEEPDTLMAELWAEWQRDDPARAGLKWGQVRGHEVQSFAAHVQAFLKARA